MVAIMNLLKKYISGDSLGWLLETSDPDVRYLTLRDVLCRAGEDDYRAAESFIAGAPGLKPGKDGVPGNPKRYDLYSTGTLWAFAEMVGRGLDRRTGLVVKTAEFLSRAGIGESGGFSLPWKPAAESALYTGEMVRLLLSAGVMDDRTESGIAWVLERQRHDGGWLHWQVGGWTDLASFLLLNRPGRGLAREADTAVMSCPYATIACASALLIYNRLRPSEKTARAVGRAAEYFLRARMHDFNASGLFNSRLIYRQNFSVPGYPVLGQYDSLSGLVFLAGAGRFNDPRASAAFNGIMARQNRDGTWDSESNQAGMMAQRGRQWPGRKSKWVTLNVFRLLKLAEETPAAPGFI